ncbi:MAG TPA: hypothetical protein VGA56_02815 [Opitutaceae bacterium]
MLDERERAAFRSEAKAAGMSLSAWLREAGRERLRENAVRSRFSSLNGLRDFFRACDAQGSDDREPDWTEHAQVINQSRRHGLPET